MSATLDEAFAWAAGGCQDPNCSHKGHDGPMYVHSRCHPSADVAVSLDPSTWTLLVECAECKQPIVTLMCAQPGNGGDQRPTAAAHMAAAKPPSRERLPKHVAKRLLHGMLDAFMEIGPIESLDWVCVYFEGYSKWMAEHGHPAPWCDDLVAEGRALVAKFLTRSKETY